MAKNLEVALDRMRQSEVLDVAAVDTDFRDPAALRERFERVIPFFARVEQEVQRDVRSIQSMLPNLDPMYGEFLHDLWQPQEVPHGQAFDKVGAALGLQAAVLATEPSPMVRKLGRVTAASPRMHDILEMVYLSRGAMHERLTATGYAQFNRQLEDMGEMGLVETMVKPIRINEATHLQFYREAASAKWPTLQPWQQRLARFISHKTYTPVGTGTNPEQQADFGHVAQILTGEDIESLTLPIQHIAEELLANGESLPHFVLNSIRGCLSANQLRVAAA